MPSLRTVALVFVCLVLPFNCYLFWRTKSHRHPYPPGPKPLPLVGNVLDMPKTTPWKTFSKLRQQYGDMIYLSALGIRMIAINSARVAADLLDKRSSNYSDRPYMPLAELTGWDINIATMPYNDEWKQHRRLYHQKFRQENVHVFRPLITIKAHELIRNLLENPQNKSMHLRNYPAAIIMYINYGHQIADRDDPLVTNSETAARMVAETILKGSEIVNVFPILRHVPYWAPGAGWKRRARRCRKKVHEMLNIPYYSVRRYMATGNKVPSWMSELLEENDAAGGGHEQEEIIKAVTGTSFAAAHDTSSSALRFFILAMILYPEVQAKAHAEIDRVVGDHRVPNFDDHEALPYIEAIYREVLRWRPPAIIGVPHAASQDDIYNGFLIPKGAMLITNIWEINHDPEIYDSPDDFIPERWLNEDGTVAANSFPSTFGFGRRICPGRALAHETIWFAILYILFTFRIRKAQREDGKEIEVSTDFTDSLVVHPLPFECTLEPRSEAHQRLVYSVPATQLDCLKIQWD